MSTEVNIDEIERRTASGVGLMEFKLPDLTTPEEIRWNIDLYGSGNYLYGGAFKGLQALKKRQGLNKDHDQHTCQNNLLPPPVKKIFRDHGVDADLYLLF